MVKIFAKLFGAFMSFFYFFYKKRKTQNKVAFISRQSETPSLDFKYLIHELRTSYPQYEIEIHCKMIPSGVVGKVLYVAEMFKQMEAMATSKVVVLDGYCILASMLKHKDELKIIQLWHALGAFKKFGRSILDAQGGKSSEVAEAFKMHNNYDLIAASGNKCVPHFAEAFGQPTEKFVPIGIPRVDFLTDKERDGELKERILRIYPELDNGKKTILYAPTFRDTDEDRASLKAQTDELVKSVNYSDFNLIVKHHVVDTNREEVYTSSHMNVKSGESFTGMELMAVADFVVTDYSSIIYEALLKDLPVYIYCFDSDKYIDERGFYIDFWRDLPALYSKNAKGICSFISEEKTADAEKTELFKANYIDKKYESVTAVWAEIIDNLIRGCYDNRYNYNE